MIYRVVIKVGYSDAYFDFDFMTEAGQFAETVLTHQTDSEDTHKEVSVRILVLKSKDMGESDA